jgi:hypothetical protein
MAYFIALGILSLLGIVATLWLIRTDGYGRIPVDPRRLPGGADSHAARAPTASHDRATLGTDMSHERASATPTALPSVRRPQRDTARA